MNVPEITRDATARRAALSQYARALDAWSEQEQVLALSGDVAGEEDAHKNAVHILFGWRKEMDDPRPEGLP